MRSVLYCGDILRLTARDVARIYGSWQHEVSAGAYASGKSLRLDTVADKGPAYGYTYGTQIEPHTIVVGVEGVPCSGLDRAIGFRHISDSVLLTAGNTLFHEYGHFLQDIDTDVDTGILISRVSMFGNDRDDTENTYYKKSWRSLPHEIDAEYNGVMMLWDQIGDMCPEQVEVFGFPGCKDGETRTMSVGDAVMLHHVNERMANTSYVLDSRLYPHGFQSRDGVESAFSDAYDRSLESERVLYSPFDSLKCELCDLFGMDSRDRHSILYPEFRDKLLYGHSSGREIDKMVATTVVHLHPDLKQQYRGVDWNELSFRNTFGMDFPEDSVASRERLGITGIVFPGSSYSRMMSMLSASGHDTTPDHDVPEPGG